MPDTPASPRASRLASPGWLDGRLVVGVLLVLVSVVVGARVLSSADRSTLVYAVTKDLAAGSVLDADDLEQVRVRLFDNADEYVAAGAPPVGYLVRRGLGRGELLPRQALALPREDVDYREVTVPIDVGHLPPGLAAGSQVDVWMTPESLEKQSAAGSADEAPADGSAGDGPGGAQLVLQGVTVLAVQADGGAFSGSTTIPVVLQVRPREVSSLVSAMSLGRIDVVRVPRGAEGAGRLDLVAGEGG